MNAAQQAMLDRCDALLARCEARRGELTKPAPTQTPKARQTPASAREQAKESMVQRYVWCASMLNISCGRCGHQDDAELFFNDRLGFERPRGVIQCPKCGWAVRREYRDGDIRLTPIQPTL